LSDVPKMDIAVDYINWILNILYSIIFTYMPHQFPISNGQVRYQLYIRIYMPLDILNPILKTNLESNI
jgi:hypothetical protein